MSALTYVETNIPSFYHETFHGCDIVATWNCRHIANANKQAHIRRLNGRLGYATPALVTPLELLETPE